MNELLKVNYDADRITLSARQLYEFLEVGSNYTTWFNRMCEYGFTENIDYQTYFPKLESESHGGQNKIDHQITLDMAKEIAMIQRNEKGKMARQYFIEIEKRWNSPEYIMKRALDIANEQVNRLMIENNEMKPKADYFDDLVERNLLTNFRDTAKELKVNQKELINLLLEEKYIFRDQRKKLKPYQEYVKNGLFELKEFSSKINSHADLQTLITPKGRETFRLLLSINT